MPGDGGDPPETLVGEAIRRGEREGVGFVIGSDANVYNTVWRSSDTNTRGDVLWEFIVSTRLVVCKRGHETTFVVANRREVLDITLASIGMAETFTDWRVDVVPSLSDQRTIIFTLMEVTVVLEVRRNIKRTDWGIFE